MQQGFNSTNVALMQGQNALATQLADCCCKTQTAIQGVNYNLATQECDTRNQMQQGFCATQNTMNNNTRDIIENQNSNTRAVLDFLTNDKIATLQSENNELRRAASQDRQSALLTTAINAQTNQIIGTLQQKVPVPSYHGAQPQRHLLWLWDRLRQLRITKSRQLFEWLFPKRKCPHQNVQPLS